jgi:hypothetical protein
MKKQDHLNQTFGPESKLATSQVEREMAGNTFNPEGRFVPDYVTGTVVAIRSSFLRSDETAGRAAIDRLLKLATSWTEVKFVAQFCDDYESRHIDFDIVVTDWNDVSMCYQEVCGIVKGIYIGLDF